MIQMYNGILILGDSGTGKTKCIHYLRLALNSLRKKIPKFDEFTDLKLWTINPKAYSFNELYGYVNIHTNEWNDGIAGKLFKDSTE